MVNLSDQMRTGASIDIDLSNLRSFSHQLVLVSKIIMARNEPSKIGYLQFWSFKYLRELPKNQKYGLAAPFSTRSIIVCSLGPLHVSNVLHTEDTPENSGPINKL